MESQGDIHRLSGTEMSHQNRGPLSMEYPRSAFTASAHPNEDWSKISDLAERRRVQNRMAQRNYRKKIKARLADLERRAAEEGSSETDTADAKEPERTAGEARPESYRSSTEAVSSYPSTDAADRSVRAQSGKPEPAPSRSPSASSSPQLCTTPQSDDNMSLRSFAESVFEIGSVASSASSLHSNSHAMVLAFVDILVCDPAMDSLLALATSEFGVSSARFRRNFSRILKSYSRHLQQAAEGSSSDVREKHLTAAKSVRKARHQASGLIASRYNERAQSAQDLKHREFDLISRHLNQPLAAFNDDPSSNEDGSEDEVDLPMGDLRQFFVSGKPFQLLKRNLRSLVIPDEFLHCIYESAREFLALVFTDRRPGSLARGLLHAIANGRDLTSALDTQFRLMATELKAECTDIAQLDASIFLETYSEYISVVAIDQVKDALTTNIQSAQGLTECNTEAALPHEGVLDRVVADTLPSVLYVDLLPHRTFLASSSAFASLIQGLRDLAYPTFFSEAKKSVKSTIRSAERTKDRPLALEGQQLLPILSEMQSCLQKKKTPTPISFSMAAEKTRVSIMDKFKIAIETSTAAEWDWWPLQPPSRSENHGRATISWKCSCGAKRYETTSPHYATMLQGLANNFPLALGGSIEPTDRPTRSPSNASSQGARSTQSADSSSTNISGGKSASSAPATTASGITSPDAGDDSVVDFDSGPRRYIYVFLLVKASEYTLDTIDVRSMKARDFFQALRATYNKHRGLMRRAFSVFVYNHCDFIKIIRPEPHTFMPGELRFELPADHDDEYHYRPRPARSAPVTRHMFRHYFYGCYDGGALSHRLHARLPLAPACRIRNPAAELLGCLPKRDRPAAAAAAQSDRVEVCYGLAARESRSFCRVVVYMCLVAAPAFWFVFAWLFVWGGGRGDLQDATVPLTLVVAMLSMLWGVVHSGSDVRKDYGDGSN